MQRDDTKSPEGVYTHIVYSFHLGPAGRTAPVKSPADMFTTEAAEGLAASTLSLSDVCYSKPF